MFENWPYLKEEYTCSSFIEGGGFTPWKKSPTEVRLLASHRHWETGALSSLVISFQREGWGLGPSERHLEVALISF